MARRGREDHRVKDKAEAAAAAARSGCHSLERQLAQAHSGSGRARGTVTQADETKRTGARNSVEKGKE
eukprot:2694485-Pyramimonas_sp.AAC.1